MYEIQDNNSLNEVAHSGGPYDSTYVDATFEKCLQKKLTPALSECSLDSCKVDKPANLDMLAYHFFIKAISKKKYTTIPWHS